MFQGNPGGLRRGRGRHRLPHAPFAARLPAGGAQGGGRGDAGAERTEQAAVVRGARCGGAPRIAGGAQDAAVAGVMDGIGERLAAARQERQEEEQRREPAASSVHGGG